MGNERDRNPEQKDKTQWGGNDGSSSTKQQQQRERPGGGQQQQEGGNQRQPGVPHTSRDTERSHEDRPGQKGQAEGRERDRDDR